MTLFICRRDVSDNMPVVEVFLDKADFVVLTKNKFSGSDYDPKSTDYEYWLTAETTESMDITVFESIEDAIFATDNWPKTNMSAGEAIPYAIVQNYKDKIRTLTDKTAAVSVEIDDLQSYFDDAELHNNVITNRQRIAILVEVEDARDDVMKEKARLDKQAYACFMQAGGSLSYRDALIKLKEELRQVLAYRLSKMKIEINKIL